MDEMLDIVETRRPLLFDQRICPFSIDHDMSGHPDIYTSPDHYDWSKHIPSEYERFLDNERETEGKAEESEDEISLD